jgi:hypothetical protein
MTTNESNAHEMRNSFAALPGFVCSAVRTVADGWVFTVEIPPTTGKRGARIPGGMQTRHIAHDGTLTVTRG